VRALVESALALAPEARGGFLERECGGDAALRAEVNALLDACERAAASPEFLAQPAAAFAAAILTGSSPFDSVPARGGETQPWEEQFRRAVAGRYEIEREVGRGGTATVYLARDLRHGRPVALKVLDPMVGAAMSAERFLREIRVTAALTHPHILPLHDSGEAAGLLYYVMPYVEGESLRDRLAREGGALPVADVVSVARELADALSYAHERGVVHRDIKPGNILLQGRHAVLADFGIARALQYAGESDASTPRDHTEFGALSTAPESRTLTRGGLSPGTPAYMAPEQAREGGTIDGRTDLYALGVVAYEALTGAHPFAARHKDGMITAHLEEIPAPIAERRTGVPPKLTALVMQLLAKDPQQRPASAVAVRRALDEVVAAPLPARNRHFGASSLVAASLFVASAAALLFWRAREASPTGVSESVGVSAASRSVYTIAVLPFVSTGGGRPDDYFSDGLTDELAHALAGLPGLRLAGRTSSFAFKGKAIPAPEIGRALGVGAIVSGTVRRAGDRLRVTTQLVNTADGTVLWDGSYERRATDVFAVQDEFTRAIIAALGPVLGQHWSTASRGALQGSLVDQRRGTQDEEAYDLYLRGRYNWLSRTNSSDLLKAIDYFHQAIARNPSFARAHAGLAMAYETLPVYLAVNGDSVMALMRTSAERAVALDSTLSDAQLALGAGLESEAKLEDALVHFRRALALDSSSVTAYHWLGLCLLTLGRTDEALVMLRRGALLDPLARSPATAVSYALVFAHQFPEAIAAARRSLALDSTFALAYNTIGLAQAFGGAPDSAVRNLEHAVSLNPGHPRLLLSLLIADAAAGRWAEARRVRAALIRPGQDRSGGITPAIAALVFGDRQPLLRELTTTAGQQRFIGTGDFLGCNPVLDPLWSEARFREAMAAIGVQACLLTRPWPIGRVPSAS
jgi:serine/threonine-protein kinase